MCLGEIGQVVEVENNGRAIVDVDGRRQEVLELTDADDDIEAGDYVLIQSGFALERLREADALEAIRVRKEAGLST